MKSTITYQRIEALVILIVATAAYFLLGFSWIYYVVFLFAVDIFMAGYLFSNRFGAILYNIGHSLAVPALLVGAFVIFDNQLLIGAACIWLAHIGLDRALGYGLKEPTGFKHTHLGEIGR